MGVIAVTNNLRYLRRIHPHPFAFAWRYGETTSPIKGEVMVR